MTTPTTAAVRAALPAYLGTDDDCRRIAEVCERAGVPVGVLVGIVCAVAEPVHQERVDLLEELILSRGTETVDGWWNVWGVDCRFAARRLVELGLYEQDGPNLFRKVAQ